jgi:hypothetical protein
VSGAPPPRAHAPALRDGRPLPPADAAVPGLAGLLDRDVMAGVLARSLRAGERLDAVRVTTVDLRPGSGCTVTYAVDLAGERRIAVATAGQGRSAEAARTPARLAIARAHGAVPAVARPLTYDAGLAAIVQWYPLDLALPVLAKPPVELRRIVARAGIEPGRADDASRTLLYRPGERAVLRLGGVVLKAYARRGDFRAGVDGLRVAAGLPLSGGVRMRAALPEHRLTVQPAIEGRPVPRPRAAEVAPVAGAMLRVLHDAAIPGLQAAPPSALLREAARSAALVGAIAPELAGRAWDLLARLEEHRPDGGPLVPSHGDFNVSQFLDVEGALVVLDFDEACLAPAALDAASYAANLIGGRPGDLAGARAALDALLGGYGARPEHVEWYLATLLLRRARNPFRLHKRRWPARIAQMLADAAEVLRP